MFGGSMSGGLSGLMFVLRVDALAAQRGDSPDLSAIYAPGTLRQARRRLVTVWVLSTVWILGFLLGALVALITLTAAFGGLVLAVDAVRGDVDRLPDPPVDPLRHPGRRRRVRGRRRAGVALGATSRADRVRQQAVCAPTQSATDHLDIRHQAGLAASP